jgi:t-SNARE complex subunit (syntaxin)
VQNAINYHFTEVEEGTFDQTQWDKKGAIITNDIKTYETLFNELTKNINYIKDNNLEKQNIDVISQIEDLLTQGKIVKEKISAIKAKAKHFSSTFETNSTQEMNPFPKINEPEIIMDLNNDQEILENRRKEYEEIEKKKALIKDTYDRMVLDLKRQEEMLDIVEKNVIEAEDNAKKAKEEIRKADEARKSNRKKLRCIIF